MIIQKIYKNSQKNTNMNTYSPYLCLGDTRISIYTPVDVIMLLQNFMLFYGVIR